MHTVDGEPGYEVEQLERDLLGLLGGAGDDLRPRQLLVIMGVGEHWTDGFLGMWGLHSALLVAGVRMEYVAVYMRRGARGSSVVALTSGDRLGLPALHLAARELKLGSILVRGMSEDPAALAEVIKYMSRACSTSWVDPRLILSPAYLEVE